MEKINVERARNLLIFIATDLRAILGDYTWTLGVFSTRNSTDEYRVVAKWGNEYWFDAVGNTPREALLNFGPAKRILAEKYEIRI
jgi:hypothetical protein